MITISNHKEQAAARLLEQYKGKPKIRALIYDLTDEIQELEDTLLGVDNGRRLQTATGASLDLIGSIVGVVRVPGQSDDDYRVAIQTKIHENVSEGEPERVTQAFRGMVDATLVYLSDAAHGEIGLMSEQVIDQARANILFPAIKKILGAAVRVESIGMFDPVEPFAVSGNLSGRGFGSLTDLTIGGKLARLFRPNDIKFAFSGVLTVGLGGYGTVNDPLVGGVF